MGRRGAASLHLQVLVEILAIALVLLHVDPVVGLHAQRAARLLRPVLAGVPPSPSPSPGHGKADGEGALG